MSFEVFDAMIGKTITKIEGKEGDDHMIFYADGGRTFGFVYHPDCCATCDVESIAVGPLAGVRP
jgi:hypothetical protein